ncbi:hypothetical protein M885DRAFT_494237 [Pelagophyceae sp. CCMP2097]|nr:hypothetical protein M885DRAFT_494237 [Pelagophyceae sp. CCMP2097]
MLATFCWPAAWVCGVGFSIGFAKCKAVDARLRCLAFLSLGGGAVAAAAAAYNSGAGDVLRCGVLRCYASDASDASDAQTEKPYNVTVGLLTLFAASAFAALQVQLAVCCAREASRVAARAHRYRRAGSEFEAGPLENPLHGTALLGAGDAEQSGESPAAPGAFGDTWRAPMPRPKTRAVFGTVLLLGVLAFLVVLTAWLPGEWSAFNSASLKAYAGFERTPAYDPERTGGVWFRTKFVKVHDGLVLKFFPDVIIFYAFLASLALLGCACKVFPEAVGRKLSKRFVVPGPFKIAVAKVVVVDVGGGTASVGLLVVVAMFAATVVMFAHYWFFDHVFHNHVTPRHEVNARSLGQMANLGLALLMLPVARNSALNEAFGIAWEQALFAHIWLGYATLALFVAHGAAWWTVFHDEGLFPADILQVPMYYPTNGAGKAGGRCADNFTVPMATITVAVVLVLTGLLSHYEVRRRRFEVFLYAHHVFLALYLVALWHAASCWYLVLGGLAHWLCDHALRTRSAACGWTVVALEARPDGVTHLELQRDDGADVEYQAGQYAFLALHDVDAFQWHPFTLSAAPADAKRCRRAAFDIKAMPATVRGGKTFTRGLRDLCDASAACDLSRLRVAVDGPHGAAFDVCAFTDVLLVAGGIGVTPCHAIFRELFHRAENLPQLRSVTLLWVVRDRAVLELFAPTFAATANDDAGGKFRLELYVDSERGREAWGQPDEHAGLAFKHGRPDAARAVRQLDKAGKPHVFVCGPPGLSAVVSKAALDADVDFHSEVFAF